MSTIPGVTFDRDGMKQAAEIFRVAAPGSHEIKMQVAEGEFVVSHIVGRGVHAGELLGIPATNKEIESEGIAIHCVRDGKIVEYWSSLILRASCSRLACCRGRPPDAPVRGRAVGARAFRCPVARARRYQVVTSSDGAERHTACRIWPLTQNHHLAPPAKTGPVSQFR